MDLQEFSTQAPVISYIRTDLLALKSNTSFLRPSTADRLKTYILDTIFHVVTAQAKVRKGSNLGSNITLKTNYVYTHTS